MLTGVKSACDTLGVVTQAVCIMLAAGAGGAIPGMFFIGLPIAFGGVSSITIGSITMGPATFGAAIGALSAEVLMGVNIGCAVYNGSTTAFWRRLPDSGATPATHFNQEIGDTGATGVTSTEYQSI